MDNKHIAIWGFGIEGQSALRYVQDRYSPASITIINKDAIEASIPVLDEQSCFEYIEKTPFDVVIKSPGISPFHPLYQYIEAHNIPITTPTNMWFADNPDAKTITVTGTKGKSSSAALIHHCLEAQGFDAVLAGNIGTPLLDTTPGKDWTVIELSSYQLFDFDHAPDLFLLLNLYTAHQSWHQSLEHYHNAKTKLITKAGQSFVHQSAQDKGGTVFSGDDFALKDGQLVYHGISHPLPICFRTPYHLENIAGAIEVLIAAGADAQKALESLSSFKGLPHRLELIGERDGVAYVNDSIATLPEPVMVALSAFPDSPVHLIMGGEDLDMDYSDLAQIIASSSVAHVYLIPDNGKKIAGFLEQCHSERAQQGEESQEVPSPREHNSLAQDDKIYSSYNSLQNAVSQAQKNAASGEVILLAPGTPSFPIFKNYKDRGEQFKRAAGF